MIINAYTVKKNPVKILRVMERFTPTVCCPFCRPAVNFVTVTRMDLYFMGLNMNDAFVKSRPWVQTTLWA